jgi:O-antigen ligase
MPGSAVNWELSAKQAGFGGVVLAVCAALTVVLVAVDPLLALGGACGMVGAVLLGKRLDFWVLSMLLILLTTATWIPGISGALQQLRWIPPLALTFFALAVTAIEKRLPRRPRASDLIFLSWIGFALLTTMYSATPGVTMQRALTLLLAYVAIFWAIWRYADVVGEEHCIDLILLAAGLIYGLSVVFMLLTADSFFENRFRGILGNPNAMGLFTTLIFPLALVRKVTTQRRRYTLLLAVLLLSGVLAGSRGSLLALLIASIYMLWRARSRLIWLVVAGTVWVVLGLLGVAPMPAHFAEYARVDQLSTGSGRLFMWPILLERIGGNLWLGHGFGTEDHVMRGVNHMIGDSNIFKGDYAHNAFIGLAVQVGVVGTAAFFLPIIALLISSLRGGRSSQRGLQFGHALQAVLIAGLVISMFESWIYSMGNGLAVLFWIEVMLLLRRNPAAHADRGGAAEVETLAPVPTGAPPRALVA